MPTADLTPYLISKCSNKKTLEGLIKSGAFSSIEKSRRQLWDNIDYITATASKEAKQKESGQGSLFDLLGDSSVVDDAKFQLAGSDEEYDQRQIQLFEKEFLGFYVTSHPLSTIRDKLPFLMTHKISEIPELPNEKVVTICGLVTAVKQIPTKKDPTKFIRFVTVEDLTGKVDCVCFHKKLLEFGDLLQQDNKVVITGRVQHRGEEGQVSVLIENVKSVENSNIVTLSLKKDVKYEELCGIKNILAKHHGDDPVMFKLPPTDGYSTKILTSPTFWVNSTNDLVNHMKQFFPNEVDVSIRSLDQPLEV